MGCRKNQATLTASEKAAFINAVVQLKTAAPSQLHPGDPQRHRYDDYVEVHMNAMMNPDGTNRSPGWAHRAPAFFPWHREMLRQFELDLQQVDPSVSLPYWDWTVDQSADAIPGSPWTDDFMGAKHDNTDGVTTGPFRSGIWVKRVFEAGDTDPDLRRALGRTAFGAGATALPSPGQVTGALGETPYDSAPWALGASPSFRDRAEGWHGLGSIHNRVHLWVGGSMLPSTSPNDPIFFLHHCNIDRLWNEWQRQHAAEGYHPTGAGTELGPPGHNLNAPMLFHDPGQPAPWPGSVTPATMLNSHLPPSTYWYDTDPPEVHLLTPTVSFADIPEGVGGTGVTTYRAIQFEVLSCAGVTFQITAGPTAPFTAPLGTAVTVPPTHEAPPAPGRVWIGYTSTTAPAIATGSVTVHCLETGEDFTIALSANTVPRPKSAVVLVLDHSGSMAEDAGDGRPKVEKLRQAILAFASVMLPGDGLGLVRFDDTVQRLSDVIDVGPVSPVIPGTGRDRAYQAVTGPDLDPAGATSLGGGVKEGRLALDTAPPTVPPYSVKAMIVVTDGVENTPPMIADVASSLTAQTFAIGLGTPANISVPALHALAQGHDGFLVVTGQITADQQFRLVKFFLQALAGVSNAQVVLDPQSELVIGATHRIPFTVVEPDSAIDVIFVSLAAPIVDFQLETPDGSVVTPGAVGAEPAVQFFRNAGLAYYRLSLPALATNPGGSRSGLWHALLRIGRGSVDLKRAQAEIGRRHTAPYELLVHAYSDLRLRAMVRQASFEPNARIELEATLSEYDVPVEGRAVVWADVTRPDARVATLRLQEGENGTFSGGFVASQVGVFTVRVRAAGSTFTGQRFEREQTLTATTSPGADRPPAGEPTAVDGLRDLDRRLCELLRCVLAEKSIQQALKRSGSDPEHLRRCLERFCPPRAPHPEATRAPTPTPEPQLTLSDVRRILSAAETHGAEFAELPEPPPREPWTPPADITPEGGPMFDLSPEDKEAGEPPEPQASQAPASPGRRRPRPAHGLSPEDQEEEDKPPPTRPRRRQES